MKKGDVVAWRLVPADQNASKAVHPAVSAFHHPAPGFETGFIFDGLSLFAPAANVGREAKLVQSLTHLVEVVALIQAQSPWGRSGVGAGRCTGRLSSVARANFMSWRLAPSTASPTGIPRPSVNRLRLTPVLPRSVGLGPVFPPAQGGLGYGSIHAQESSSPDPSIHHNVPVPPAKAARRPRRRPIPESGDGPWSRSKCSWRPTPSTGNRCAAPGNRCAAHRRYRWRRSGLEPGAVLRPRGGYLLAWESVGPAPPTGRRIPERNWWWDWLAWLGLRGGAGVTWVLLLWSSLKFSFNSGFFHRAALTGYQCFCF